LTLPHPPLWLTLVAFICALGPLVFFHELGHFLAARFFKIPAEVFSIGFGREIVGWTDRQGTRWKICWLPIGGYVRFVGDMNPASAPVDPEELTPEDRERSFHTRPVWQRFIVVLAGPMANFILAIAIFTAFFTFIGAPQTNVVGKIVANSAAAKAGLRPGDRILSIADRDTSTFDDIFNVVAVRPNETVPLKLQRGSATRTVEVTLGSDQLEQLPGQKVKRGLLGVSATTRVTAPVPFYEALPMAVRYTGKTIRSTTDAIGQMFRGRVSPQQLGGPIKIAQFAGEAAAIGPLSFVDLIAMLSINLGFINLLPVPLLDGGHLFLYLIEGVRRRAPSAEVVEWAFRGGLALILALFLFVIVNDLGGLGLFEGLQRLIG
jgi:regulator of sigma E protease